MTKVLWYPEDGEKLPTWYRRQPRPLNVVWQATIEYLVHRGWMVAFRMWLGPEGRFRESLSAEARFGWLLREQEDIQEKCHMASGKNRSVAVRGWANISLNDEDKDAILSAEISVETLLQDVGALVFRGYRFSMTFDNYSSSCQATLVCCDPEDGNYEHGLSARHPDPIVALKTLLYKHGLTRDTGWREFVRERQVDNWG
jgi:hypothetical protein